MRRREFLALLTAGGDRRFVGGSARLTEAQTDVAREAGRMPTQAELDAMVQEWWETVRIDRTREDVWDDEIGAVDALMDDVDEFPEWSLQVRGAMPRSGFEMCSHRWLDGGGDALTATAERWRARGDANTVLAAIFAPGEGLIGLLQNRCGYKVIDRLDILIRMIGGDDSQAGDLPGTCCRRQIGMSLRDDPARYYETLGMLWGLGARLTGRDEAWLRANKPAVAEAAARALGEVQRAGELAPLRRWLVASMLKATKIWCAFALWDAGDVELPDHARDLPDALAALAT